MDIKPALTKGLLIALPLALGIWFVADRVAGAMSAGFATAEARRQTRTVAVASLSGSALADFKQATAGCRKLAGAERLTCTREALRAQREAAAEARAELRCRERTGSGMPVEPRVPQAIDLALYRAHRQLFQ
ncbi:MAG TPA: hypothetical protein VFV17_05925 [Usitatibacteraceae bacterium]|nr:hypothetical protein [Usitatibacteraceae bacterium]